MLLPVGLHIPAGGKLSAGRRYCRRHVHLGYGVGNGGEYCCLDRLHHIGYPAITLHMDIRFGESGYSQNAIIRGNTVINGAVDEGLRWSCSTGQLGAILIGYWLDGAHTGYQNNYEHKNILIENNVIQGTSLYGIACLNVDGLTIRGNTVTDPFKFGIGRVGSGFGVTPDAGIFIGQCRNVTVTGNTVSGGPTEITQAVQLDKNVANI